MNSAWRLISILLAATTALAAPEYEIQSDMYQRGRDGEHLTERARASFFGRMSFQVLRAFKQLQRQTQDAGPLFKKPRVDEEEEDDVKEEVDGRQKLRIDESGCKGSVMEFPTQKNGNLLLVELDENQGENCPALDLVKIGMLNGINSYDKWNDVVILALPKEGWQKKATPDYRFSGAYSHGPIKPVACLRRDLTEGKEGLDETRIWAAAGHPDVSDSC